MNIQVFLKRVAASFLAAAMMSAPALSTAQTTPATTSVVSAAPAGASKAAAVDNPYGVKALWNQSDLVAKIVLALLALQSMGTWYILVSKLNEQRRMGKQARKTESTFWKAGSVQDATAALDADSPFRYIAETGLEARQKHVGLHDSVEFHDWVALSVDKAVVRVQRRLQSGLAFLASVGSTAPFIGLFGTVWGIYHALTAIGVAGQASIDKVAGPVGESLIMTALGLAVAVPAVLGYNWLVRRNTVINDDLQDFGDELHAVMLADQAR